MTAKKEVATQDEQSNALVGFDFEGDVGAGMEGADKDSFAIPFLRVLQKISPEVDEAEGAFIEGAKPSMLLDTVTQKLYDGKEGVIFLPCAFQRRFIQWGPRGGEGSGFKGEFFPEDVRAMHQRGELVEQDGKLYFPKEDGTIDPKKCDYMDDTRSHFGLLVDEETGAASKVLIPLSSTQIKKSKQLISMLDSIKVRGSSGNLVTPPTWVNRVRITTVPESNDKGSWYGVKFSPEGFIQDADLYQMGKDFHAAVAEGQAKANYAEAETTGESSDDGKF